MQRAFVLMTAMPPTVGHFNLIKFASRLAQEVIVIVNTQPGEPFSTERVVALQHAVEKLDRKNVTVTNIHRNLPQAPEECDHPEDFWTMWLDFLIERGYQWGDGIVASEEYGIELAAYVGGKFMPYDMNRELQFSKATYVREDLWQNWDWVLPEFQRFIRPRITIFGAESTGKTTLSQGLAADLSGQWLFEYARPYLETVGPEITTQSMEDIWRGQLALQQHGQDIATGRAIVQDTDLFSTVGYWNFWQPATMPKQLELDAITHRSDLYIVMNSHIPFEEDPIRYGGDKRESDDQYWIDLCDRYELNYHIMEATEPVAQLEEAKAWSEEYMDRISYQLEYKRSSNE